ncbi:M-phase phosphoprotein 8 [Merluccius polli]|uniref:M-phase phosphoprotein 8 n=1 Tax=Merluccius polli TaxID=89951 RepID=A0AA47MR99_MERPO|nr:M-phase phosphoprotein 8 [Merluccius polli]
MSNPDSLAEANVLLSVNAAVPAVGDELGAAAAMEAEVEKPEPADSEQDEEEDVYEVERIIDMRVEEVLYRVRWKNYCSDDDTWEPEAHLEDCREVLLNYKKNNAEIKLKKDAEAKKVTKLPTKTDVFDADSESDGDKDAPGDLPKKKKKKLAEEPSPKEKRRKKKDKKREEMTKPLPAPETDDEEEDDARPPTPSCPSPSQPKEKPPEKKKRTVDSDEEEEELAPSKKHRKDKGKEAGKHRKEKAEEGRKKKGKKDRKMESSEDEGPAPREEDPGDEGRSDEKARQKKGQRSELKLQGFKDLLQDKKPRKSEGGLQKTKSQNSKPRDDPAPLSSDSSDSSSLHKKARSKAAPEGTVPPPAAKVPLSCSSIASSSSSSSSLASAGGKAREEEAAGKEGESTPAGQKEGAGSTNLFEKFLLNCEAKDRVPRRQALHQPPVATETSSSSSSAGKPPKLIGKIEKKGKSTKDSPAQKSDADKMATKQTEGPRAGQSHGFSLDSDEKEVEEPAPRPPRMGGEERRDAGGEEAQRPGWERRTPTDERRWKRREDSESRLFLACDDAADPPDPLEGADKTRGQASLSLGMDLNLDWMTLEDFQKHLNGEDEILSGPPLSPSELRDAVKSGDYMSVKLALNSKEEYNLDQEACSVEEKMAFEGDKSLIEERSSHTSCRFNLGMESATEEGTLRLNDNILQDLEGPISGYTCPNTADLPRQVQNKEDERCLNKDNHTDGELLSYKTPELQVPVDTNVELTGEMSLGFNRDSSSNDSEIIPVGELSNPADHNRLEDIQPMQMEDQVDDQVGQWSFPCDPAESIDGIQAAEYNTTVKSVQKNAEGPKSKTGRRKIKERRQPTRFSSRTCKKVLQTTSTLEEDDEDDDEEPSKKHFCLYCKNPFCRLLRHLELRHSDETEVAHAVHFPKGSKIRHTLLDQIRNKGDYEHNCRVLKSGEGEIVTKRNMNNPTLSVRDYLPCQHCLAFYRKTDLWKHERSCKRKGDQKTDMGRKRCRVQSDASRLLPMSEFLTGGCEEIIHIMHQDDISHHVRNDPLICKYGNALSAKHDHDRSQFAYIAQKMRELGRFVLAANEIDSSVQYLHEMCTPYRFELAVEGAKKLAGFDPNSSRYKTVSLVSKIGYSLKRAAEIAFGESRMTEDSETEAQIQRFINLLDKKWNKSFFTSSRMASHRDFQKVEIDKSTLTEDLIKLYRFIKSVGDDATQELKENPGSSSWRKLGEVTLTEVYLFNRGRVGNTGRMLLKEYNSKKTEVPFMPSADQILKCTKLELELKDGLTRLELEGHGCRNMLVLLTAKMVSSIDLLNETRDKASVAEGNPYVFARNECLSPLRAFDYLRKAAAECGVENPDAILSATLRDQVSSYWQLMSLKEHELDKIAKLLDRSSQECSKLPENPSLLEEMSKQLLKMDRTLYFSPAETSGPAETSEAIHRSVARKKGWSEEEQEAVKRYLGHCFTLMKLPGKKQCMACITAEPALSARSWTDVKSYVHNRLQTMKRKYFHRKARGDVRILKKKNQRGGGPAIKELPHKNNKDFVLSRTTDPPTEQREVTSANPAAVLYPQAKAVKTSGHSSMSGFQTNLEETNPPMIPTFTPLNAQTFTLEIARSTPLSPPYSPQHTTSMPVLPAYSPQHTTSMPGHPAAYSPHGSSPPMIPTFMPLNAPSSQMVPRFTPLNDRRSNMLSSFRPLNHSSTPVFPASPPRTDNTNPLPSTHSTNPNPSTQTTNPNPSTQTTNPNPSTQTTNPNPRTHITSPNPRTDSNNPTPSPYTTNLIPSTHARSPSVKHRTPAVKKKDLSVATLDTQPPSSSPQKTPKRAKRLWSEAEQSAVRRQLGDICMLTKVPGKKECDACLAAEPALRSRTWREVKYFVHNTIQSKKKRGNAPSKHTVTLNSGVHNSSAEWDAPDSSGMSLSMLAAAGGQDDILRLLIRKGVRVNGRQKNGTTALMHAAEKNFLTTVAILLEAGCHVNAQTLGGETALMKACKRGNADIVRLLLDYGGDCNILSRHKNTAYVSNNLTVCDLIKDHSAT